MMSSQEVPQGYKKTKVGVIPLEWEVVKLDEVAKFYKGKGISKAEISDKGIECIRYGELYTKYNEKIENIISKTITSKDKLFLSEVNDILIPASGETAIDLATASCVLKKDVGLGGDINIIRSKLDGIFLSYYLNIVAKTKIASLAQGISVIHLYSSQLKNLYISKPPLKEQQKIAKILTTWDNAIFKQEKLIKAKEQLKKGLMQKLLSGEVRFDGFSGEWENIRLGEITNFYLGLTYTPTYVKKGVPFLSVKDINGGNISFENIKYISNEEFEHCTNNSKPKKGDILFGRVGTLGNPIIIETDNPFCIFVSLGFLRVNSDIYNGFVKYWMSSSLFKKQVESQVAGSSQKNLNVGWLKKFKLKLPPLQEQQKIAQVLSTADKEIELLKNELESLKEQKKGLMQRLLTGEVRVEV